MSWRPLLACGNDNDAPPPCPAGENLLKAAAPPKDFAALATCASLSDCALAAGPTEAGCYFGTSLASREDPQKLREEVCRYHCRLAVVSVVLCGASDSGSGQCTRHGLSQHRLSARRQSTEAFKRPPAGPSELRKGQLGGVFCVWTVKGLELCGARSHSSSPVTW